MDDDMMVNFTKLDNYLTQPDINHKALHCLVQEYMPAIRESESKW